MIVARTSFRRRVIQRMQPNDSAAKHCAGIGFDPGRLVAIRSNNKRIMRVPGTEIVLIVPLKLAVNVAVLLPCPSNVTSPTAVAGPMPVTKPDPDTT